MKKEKELRQLILDNPQCELLIRCDEETWKDEYKLEYCNIYNIKIQELAKVEENLYLTDEELLQYVMAWLEKENSESPLSLEQNGMKFEQELYSYKTKKYIVVCC